MSAIVRHSWPMLLGLCATAAVLITPVAAGAQSQPIQACANKQGKIVSIGVTCTKKQTSLSWNTAGPQGPAGPVGPQGAQGPPGSAGPTGPQGSAGPAGPQGAAGSQGPTGPTGSTGPVGSIGPAGAPGPQGPAGAVGATGGSGNPGTAGSSGDNLVTLTGSNFAGTDFPGVGEEFDFDSNSSIPGTGNTPFYYGPGNQVSSASGTSLASESVPLPAGTLSNLVVQVDEAPGTDQSYTFETCINAATSGVCNGNIVCTISGTAQSCTSATATDVISDGDVVAIEAIGTANSASADVSWSMNLQLQTPTPTSTPTPTPTTPTATPTPTP